MHETIPVVVCLSVLELLSSVTTRPEIESRVGKFVEWVRAPQYAIPSTLPLAILTESLNPGMV